MSNRSTQPIDAHIGQRLQRRRRRLGWTQQQLGDRLGVKFQQIQKYEVGQNRIAAGRLYEIAKLLRVPLLYFFEGFEPEANMPPRPPDRGVHEEAAVWQASDGDEPAPIYEDWQAVADFYLAIGDSAVRRSVRAIMQALARSPHEPDAQAER